MQARDSAKTDGCSVLRAWCSPARASGLGPAAHNGQARRLPRRRMQRGSRLLRALLLQRTGRPGGRRVVHRIHPPHRMYRVHRVCAGWPMRRRPPKPPPRQRLALHWRYPRSNSPKSTRGSIRATGCVCETHSPPKSRGGCPFPSAMQALMRSACRRRWRRGASPGSRGSTWFWWIAHRASRRSSSIFEAARPSHGG